MRSGTCVCIPLNSIRKIVMKFIKRKSTCTTSIFNNISISLNQLFKSSTRFLFTGWIDFCTAVPNPTSDLLDDLRKVDLGALFFCMQVVLSRARSENTAEGYDLTWNGTFGKMVSWLESSVRSLWKVHTFGADTMIDRTCGFYAH